MTFIFKVQEHNRWKLGEICLIKIQLPELKARSNQETLESSLTEYFNQGGREILELPSPKLQREYKILQKLEQL